MTIDEPLPPYRQFDSLSIEQAEPPRVLSVVHDYEQIADELFTKVDEELIEFKCVHWDIEDWRQLPDCAYGPKFEIGGHEWNLLLYPKGNLQNSFASVYLQWKGDKSARDSGDGKKDSYACAQFAICLSHPQYPTNYVSYAGHHRFTSEEDDWGFSRLVNFDRIYQPDDETNRAPLLKEGQIRATAIVRVLKDPTGVLWHNFINYDSKKHTGFIGIKNAGSTGYLTVLLQLLFHTVYFRQKIYEAPATEKSILAELQQLFIRLQYSPKAIDTNNLTKSFGWTSFDLVMQQDVIEMKQVLQSALERGNAELSSLFQRVFGIHYANGQCDYDIALEADGFSDLFGSLSNHVFEKRNVIDQLPPVLHMQLRRFRFNKARGILEKVNDRFSYPLEIDLKPFLGQYNDRSESHVYVLQSYMISTVTRVNPTTEEMNLKKGLILMSLRIKFLDDQVHPVKEADVLEGCYGGPPLDKPDSPNRTASAYVLSYVRKSRIGEMLPEIPIGTLMHILGKRLAENQFLGLRVAENKQLLVQGTHRKVWIIRKEAFTANKKGELFDMMHESIKTFNLPKAQGRFAVLEAMIKAQVKLPAEKYRLWPLIKRINDTWRPDCVLDLTTNKNLPKSLNMSLYLYTTLRTMTPHTVVESYLRKSGISHTADELMVYMETPVGAPLGKDQILLFIKYFDIETQNLKPLDHIIVNSKDAVQSLAVVINLLVGNASNTPLEFYEEVKPAMIDKLQKSSRAFFEHELQNGDIICAQKVLTLKELKNLNVKYHDVTTYLTDKINNQL